MGIGTKITILLLSICGIGMYLFTNQELDSTVRQYREATEEPLVDFAYLLSSLISREASASNLVSSNMQTALLEANRLSFSAKVYDLTKNQIELRIYVSDKNGAVVYDSQENREVGSNFSQWNDIIKALRGDYGARTSRTDPGSPDSTLYISAPIKKDSQIIGVVTVAKSNRSANLFIKAAKRSTTYLAVVTFIGISFLTFALTYFVTRPIRKLTNYAQSIRDGREVSIPILPKGEMRQLGESLEEMRVALEGKDYVERYVQTITHELKSPLTAIKGAAELLQEDLPSDERKRFLNNLTTESERVESLIKKLLTLVSIERGAQQNTEPISVQKLLLEASETMLSVAQQKNITLKIENSEDRQIQGDFFWLLEALKNLISNAIDFSPQNSYVSLGFEMKDQKYYLSVSDSGPGIPEWALDKVCDQFFSLPRPDSNKRSSGLGLSIVQEIARRHAAVIQIQNKLEKGLKISIGPFLGAPI